MPRSSSDHRPSSSHPRPSDSRWRRGCAHARSTTSSGSAGCWHRASRCGVPSNLVERARWCCGARHGSGKTTLARLIAATSGAAVEQLSAVADGVADLKQVIVRARARSGSTILIVDEIHRWSRSQQAALLPHVEDGLVNLIGVTSENPYFDIIAPLRSRLRIFHLEPLDRDDVLAILRRAIEDAENGIGGLDIDVADEALDLLANLAGGDARTALNALEAAAEATRGAGSRRIESETVVEAMQARQVRYDRQADDHYQTISAFIKSVRGSDPDAAMFWLGKDGDRRRRSALHHPAAGDPGV